MAASIGQIGLDLVVNKNDFEKQMNGIQGMAKKAGAALAAAFGIKKLVDFSGQCLKLGSDLAEVQNVVDVTFPNMTTQVDKFAQSAETGFGLSRTMAKQFTGTFGTMAKAFGFTESAAYEMGSTLTGLAGDVASFYNISQDEAYTKLKSVFTGETESLKDLGVVMTQTALDAYAMEAGFGKATSAMSEAEKVALRYQFVQDRLAAAQGDFARTSGGWANQVRILKLQFDSLKASIGQGLINLFTPVLQTINMVIGKLATLASAFKAFTELITGSKSSGGSQISGMGAMAEDAGAGFENASGAADGMASSADSAGSAAKKAAKEMKALMGFDKVNKIQEPSESADTGSPGGGTAVGGTGSTVDFGGLAEGNTVIDSVDGKFQGLIARCRELAELFRQGFTIGFGDSEVRIQSIKGHIQGIGQSLKGIFTDPSVVRSAGRLFDSIALNAGKIAGSMASIGITIADNLLGGIDGYLQESSPYIRDRLVSLFDVSAEIAGLVGDFAVAAADIFSVFSGENAKSCTASLIGIFSDTFLGIKDLTLQFARDVIECIVDPIVENKDLIKESIDETLAPISDTLGVIHKGIKDTFEKINGEYERKVRPMFKAFSEGLTEIVGTLFEGYNMYIVPVLDRLSEKFRSVWEEHIQPMLDKGIELIGKVAGAVTDIWNATLQPFLNWFAKNIAPVLGRELEKVGNSFLDGVAVISDAIGTIFDLLGDVIEFVAGVFTGDWKRAWNGIENFFKKLWGGFKEIVRSPVNAIIGFINGMVNGMANGVNSIASMLNSLSIDIPDWVPVIGGGKLSFNFPMWTPRTIPYLAQGGFVKANTPRLAMIGDNRHYGEIVAPEDKMKAMVDAAVQAAAGSGGVTKDELERIINLAVSRIVAALESVGFFLDGEELARLQGMAQKSADIRYNEVTLK